MRLCHVGDVEALQAVVTIEVEVPEVEDMLNILDAVDVSVDVHVAVVSVDDAQTACFLRELHTLEGLYWARLVGLDILGDESVTLGKDVHRLARVRIYHRPDASSVAETFALGVADGIVTAGEEAHDVFHPCVDGNTVVSLRHLLHLHHEA